MSNSDNVTYTQRGERAAMGGYLPQYDAFAIGVYDAMQAGVLEEIRVADMEDNVGKLDDIVYATQDGVHAYQLKYSKTEAQMAYSAFRDLIGDIVEGWRKLKKTYVDKTVYPYLMTNKSLTEGDNTIKALVDKDAGGFKSYEHEVLEKLKSGEPIDAKWDKAVKELQTRSTLTQEEWGEFWKVFTFLHDYAQETIEIARANEDQRTYDIICINRMIQEMAAGKGYQIKLTVREIITRLNWEKRFETKFDHNLNVPEDSYVPNAQGLSLLDAALQGKTRGYVFLKGSPGAGKSTLLTQWTRNIKNPSVRFYAFDFLNPSSQRNNDSSRGSGLVFLHDIILQIRETGVEGNRTILPNMDAEALRNRFYAQLDAISEQFKKTGIPFVIIVDGLDHITREYTACLQTLMKVLPSPTDIPEGVVFVLGSQHYDHLGLNPAIEKEILVAGNLVEMPSLSRDESVNLCKKLLPPALITEEVQEKCWKKSLGHPLYLRYLLNHIVTAGVAVIETLDDSPEGVEDYYARIVGTRLEDVDVRDALGLVARISGNILLDDVRDLCKKNALLVIKNQMWHLFKYDEGGQSLAFFHNSFRQYLLNKTAEEILTGKYSKTEEIDYYKRLAEHFKDGWEKGYYLYYAEEYDQFLTQMSPERLYKQTQNYRPLWSVTRDLRRGVEIARRKKDPYMLVRYLFLENQISQMDNQDYSVLSLTEEFIHTGRSTLAKAIVREGRQLYCSQEYAMTLAVEYFNTGDKDEANLLFALSYPEFLSHKPEDRRNTYRELKDKKEYLADWVRTAGYFLEWADIERQIAIFIPYLTELAAHDNESFDVDEFRHRLILSYLESLTAQNRWDEFEAMILSLGKNNASLYVAFSAYDNAIIHLSQQKGDKSQLTRYFSEEEKVYAALPQDSIHNLVMANLTERSNQVAETVMGYLNKVRWEDIGSYYMDVSQKFETIKPHIFYVKTRAKYGVLDKMTSLVPDNPDHEDNDLMVNYARRVFSIAQMAGEALVGVTDAGFLKLVSLSLGYFDTLEPPLAQHNRYAYPISQQRKDFYEFVVEMAADFGGEMIDKVAQAFEHYFSESSCRADGASQRMAIMALFREGYDPEWCKCQLERVDGLIMTWKDLDGRVSESLKQGKAWLEMGYYNKAEAYFHQMIEETFGVGYRKDSQPTQFAEWLGEAIQREPEHATEHVHWLTSRLRYIDEIAETRTAYRAANRLLHETLKYNLRSGLKLAFWLLDEEFEYYQSVSSALLHILLAKSEKAEEYLSLFRLFTDLHLYNDENDVYDLSTSLLQAIITHGKRILGGDFNRVIPQLQQKIKTECPENIVEGLLKSLDEVLLPKESTPSDDSGRERDQKLAEAKALLEKGQISAAWNAAMEALSDSTQSGWSRFYDGGSRINICKVLQEIDLQKGRDFTLDLFASDIPGGYAYGTLPYLDEIVPLLTEQVDYKRLFDEEFAYMNRILREDTVNNDDKPDITPDNSTVYEIIRDWLLFLAKMPVISVSERAKIQLARLYDETDTVLALSFGDVDNELLGLEIGGYLAEIRSARLPEFVEQARKSAVSPNYQYRLYAAKILNALGEPIPEAPHKTLPATYGLSFSPAEAKPLSWLPGEDHSLDIDWKNASSVMGVASHWSGYLAYCADIEQRTLDYRAVELMKKYGMAGDGNVAEDKRIMHHYDQIGLRCPYRKAHAIAALNGMLEVASELKDGGAVKGRYQDSVFVSRDFSNIRIIAQSKPDFVHRLAPAGEWGVNKDWMDNADKCIRFNEPLPEYDDGIVIGEYTHLKKAGDNPALEEYEAKISFFPDKTDSESSSIFGDSPFMQPTSKYLELGEQDPEAVLLRGGYYTDFSNKSHWIAINPALAYSLGWEPSGDGYFAWRDAKGEKMAESVYWQSGNINMFTRSSIESGEGWIVVVSKEAMAIIASMTALFLHKKVLRRRGTNPADMSHQAYSVEKMKR